MGRFKIAILGNRDENYQPHCRMNDALGYLQGSYDFTFDWVPTECLHGDVTAILHDYQGIVAGSGPYKSKEGVINGIRYARQNDVPFLGTCSGFGYAVLEFGQWLFGLPEVYHPYERGDLPENERFLEPLNYCSKEMYPVGFELVPGTLTNQLYGDCRRVTEQSHCWYGVNRQMIPVFGQAGLIVAGNDDEGEPKMMEYNRNRFFIITLFLPQLQSNTKMPHPLLAALVKAAAYLYLNGPLPAIVDSTDDQKLYR